MQLWTDLIDPADLTAFGRTIMEDYLAQDALSQILPNAFVDDVVFSWIVNETLVDLAEYRAFDAETPIGKGLESEEKTAKLAAVGLKKRFGEYDQLRRRGANSPETVQAAADRLAEAVVRATADRVTLLKAEALVTGALAINENRFVQNVSFGRAAGQTNAAPAALWSATGADPITDLLGWVEDVEDASGVTPDRIITSTRVFSALAAALAGGDYVTTQTGVVSQEVVNSVLVSYGLPQITIYNRKIGGIRVIADDKLILAPAGGMAGATVWGTSVDADEPNYGLSQLPGIVVGPYKTEDPNTKWIRSDAIALPILATPDATLSADVL